MCQRVTLPTGDSLTSWRKGLSNWSWLSTLRVKAADCILGCSGQSMAVGEGRWSFHLLLLLWAPRASQTWPQWRAPRASALPGPTLSALRVAAWSIGANSHQC